MADLTVLQIDAIKVGSIYKKYPVSKGLYVGVASNGEKGFVIRYSVDGTQRDYRLPKPFGKKSSPAHTSLAEARELAGEIRALGKQGIDYQVKKAQEHTAALASAEAQHANNLTLDDLYKAWFDTTRHKDKGAELSRSMKKHVLPFIGSLPIKKLEEGHIKDVLKPISNKGHNRMAVVVLNNLKQMFKWGGGRSPWKHLLDDPSTNLKPSDVTEKDYLEVERDRYLSEQEVRDLSKKLPDAGLQKYIESIIWITLSCCTRIGETVKAKWENIDLTNGVWIIPEKDTKGKAPSHTIYLSTFSIQQFSKLKQITGHTDYCFPNSTATSHNCIKSPTKQIGDRQLSTKNRLTPLKNRTKLTESLTLAGGGWSPHDLRRTGATTMQALGIDQHIIERVLNHVEQNRMLRTYQRHDYATEVKDAWSKLGERLNLLTQTS